MANVKFIHSIIITIFMCLFTNSSEICNHPECIRFYVSSRVPQLNNSSLIASLTTIMQQQAFALNDLVQKNSLLNQNLDRLNQNLSNNSKSAGSVTEDKFSLEGIFRWISSDRVFPMFINLINGFPEVIFKEKGFRLDVNVVDSTGASVPIPNNLNFMVALFTVENPPKLLKYNISGKKILRGTTEVVADNNGEACFQNIVINEVTSHYPSDKFCFVILCPSSQQIKPLAISGVSVRARKHRN